MKRELPISVYGALKQRIAADQERQAAERNRRYAVEGALTDIRFARYVSGYREGMDAIALDFIEALERRGYTVASTRP